MLIVISRLWIRKQLKKDLAKEIIKKTIKKGKWEWNKNGTLEKNQLKTKQGSNGRTEKQKRYKT